MWDRTLLPRHHRGTLYCKLVAMQQESILVFASCPDAGKCQIGLIPRLGEEGARRVHRSLTMCTLNLVSRSSGLGARAVNVLHPEESSRDLSEMVGHHCSTATMSPQSTGDLANKLHVGFSNAFEAGQSRTIAIGTDCPFLTQEIIEQALRQLSRYDIVLGPAKDGGLYLIGLTQSYPELFSGIDLGEKNVTLQMVEKANHLGLSMTFLTELPNVNSPEDVTMSVLSKISNYIS